MKLFSRAFQNRQSISPLLTVSTIKLSSEVIITKIKKKNCVIMSTLEDTEIHVRLEDQKKINLFARKTTYLNDLKVQIKDAKKKLQNVEDASDDLELLDDDEVIGYKIGEVFIDHPIEHTQTLLGELKNDLCQRIKDLEGNVTQIETLLKDLKVQLYAKFGDNINLED